MKRALVLGGGGSRGAYQIGVWQALRELDWKFEIVTGTSVGAINGAVICMDDFERAGRLWSEMETATVFNLCIEETAKAEDQWKAVVKEFIYRFLSEGGVGTDPLKKLLSELYDERKIRNSHMDLGIVTVNLQKHRAEQLFLEDIPKGKLVDYVLASSSVFPALKMYEIEKKKYIDGCYYDNLPIDMAVSKGAKEIVAVDLEGVGVVRRKNLKELSDVKIHYVKSHWNLGNMLIFDRALTKRNLRLGYLDGLKAFGVFDGKAYTFVKNQMAQLYHAYRVEYTQLLYRLGLISSEPVFWKQLMPSSVSSRSKQQQILFSGMEQAGRIFGLNPEKIYSAARFNQNLLREYQKWMDENQFQNLNRKEKDRRKRTAFLVELILQKKELTATKRFRYLTTIFSSEWKAAVYLALLKIKHGRQI